MSAETADLAVERFIYEEGPKPLFLLNLLVGRKESIKKPETLISLLRYIRRHYIGTPPPSHGQTGFDLTWPHFVLLLRRLVSTCVKLWPKLLPSVSQLAVSFIENLPHEVGGSTQRAHAVRCEVFNQALEMFSSTPQIYPLADMVCNWEAQKHLLNLSSRLNPTLFIRRDGYRAIRRVLVALPKSLSEREVAKRASKTWPPYRRDFDGRDEQRRPEDDLSLVVRAGILKREAGYPDDQVDRALDALGGFVVGQTPTTQTRALIPPIWTGRNAGRNLDIEWAAKVKATRNAREAWGVFSTPLQPGVGPGSPVYAEMFDKLFATEVADSSGSILPGDSKEVFPVYNGNLSALEIARISPPTPEELYEMMLFSGIRPTGECLIVLLREAKSKEMALRYVSDSPHPNIAPMLRTPFSTEQANIAEMLSVLPHRVFNAWVKMLCKTHGISSSKQCGTVSDISGHILEAIFLTTAYEEVKRETGIVSKAPWYIILEALAGPKMLYSQNGPEGNVAFTLRIFMWNWQQTVNAKGIDCRLFEQLCLIVRKSLRLATFRDTKMATTTHGTIRDPHGKLRGLLARSVMALHEAFDGLTQPLREFDGSAGACGSMILAHRITAKHLFRYMQSLGTVGDGEGMARLMRWILEAWNHDHLLEEARHPWEPGFEYVMRTLAYFSSVGRYTLDTDTMQNLRDHLEELRQESNCTWAWPVEGIKTGADVAVDLEAAARWSRVMELVRCRHGINAVEPAHQAEQGPEPSSFSCGSSV